MTKEQVQKFRDKFKDNAMIVVCDNQHLFYDNVGGKFPLIWDDENEVLTTMVMNDDIYSQSLNPVYIEMTEYEHIQFIQIFINANQAMDYIEEIKDQWSGNIENKHDWAISTISKLNASHLINNPYKTTAHNEDEEP